MGGPVEILSHLAISQDYMQTVTKSQVLDDLREHFKRVVDGIGTPIDQGILDTVVAFNAIGLYTTASCEGHIDEGLAHPWIDISCEDAEKLAGKIAWKLYEGKREEEETKRMMQQHRLCLLREEQKLVEFLDAFYQQHRFNYERHLSICRFSNGAPRIQSYGADHQEFRDTHERAQKLKEYQQEMLRFAEFLRDRFFAGGNNA